MCHLDHHRRFLSKIIGRNSSILMLQEAVRSYRPFRHERRARARDLELCQFALSSTSSGFHTDHAHPAPVHACRPAPASSTVHRLWPISEHFSGTPLLSELRLATTSKSWRPWRSSTLARRPGAQTEAQIAAGCGDVVVLLWRIRPASVAHRMQSARGRLLEPTGGALAHKSACLAAEGAHWMVPVFETTMCRSEPSSAPVVDFCRQEGDARRLHVVPPDQHDSFRLPCHGLWTSGAFLCHTASACARYLCVTWSGRGAHGHDGWLVGGLCMHDTYTAWECAHSQGQPLMTVFSRPYLLFYFQ